MTNEWKDELENELLPILRKYRDKLIDGGQLIGEAGYNVGNAARKIVRRWEGFCQLACSDIQPLPSDAVEPGTSRYPARTA